MFVKEITKRYDGKAVVDGVSFEIPKGKVLSLIGPNGAGKSTVMGMLSRLIARDSGLVDFEGTEITRWKSRELSKRLAILTQANNVQMKLTVRELVAFGRFPYSGGRLTQEDNEIIDRAIAYMELGDFEEQFIDELSGGQRQRAYIAMVIAQDTEYILLDEPTNNLDIYHATNLMLMQAIQMTIPNFRLSKIEDYLYTLDEMKLVNQIGNAYSLAGDNEKAADIFYRLLQYMRRHLPEMVTSNRMLPLVLYNFARSLDLLERYEESARVARNGKEACIKYGHYQVLHSCLEIEAECDFFLGKKEESAERYREAFYICKVMRYEDDLQIIRNEAQKYLDIIF